MNRSMLMNRFLTSYMLAVHQAVGSGLHIDLQKLPLMAHPDNPTLVHKSSKLSAASVLSPIRLLDMGRGVWL